MEVNAPPARPPSSKLINDKISKPYCMMFYSRIEPGETVQWYITSRTRISSKGRIKFDFPGRVGDEFKPRTQLRVQVTTENRPSSGSTKQQRIDPAQGSIYNREQTQLRVQVTTENRLSSGANIQQRTDPAQGPLYNREQTQLRVHYTTENRSSSGFNIHQRTDPAQGPSYNRE